MSFVITYNKQEVDFIKILIFGEYNVFTLCLISRLKKEDNQVFVVTGKVRKNGVKPVEVFQEYNFTYDSDSISYILKSIEPDIVLFSGASDSILDMDHNKNQCSKYISGLTNVVIHCKDLNIKKFIYISSCSVFEGNEGIIDDDTRPIATNNRNKAILMGEKICTDYHEEISYITHIVRVGEIYGKYKDEIIEDSVCTRMINEALKDNIVSVYNNSQHNLIYIDDIIDSIYRIIVQRTEKNTVYNITSDSVYDEVQLIKVIEEVINKKIEIDTKKSDKRISNYELQNIKELGFKEKYDIKRGIKNVYKVIDKKTTIETKDDKQRASFIGNMFRFPNRKKNIILSLIENILFFLVLQSLIIFTKSFSLHEIIDIYLLYVIVIAVIYGYIQAVFAVAFSIMGKIYTYLFIDSSYIAFNDYDIYLWILQLFAIGVLIGYLKDKYRRRYKDLKDEKDYLKLELENIKDINNSNVEVKSLYEKRLINYKDSFARIYNIVSQLDAIEPQEVIFKSVNVVCEIMNTQDVAIYTCDSNSQFCRLMAASTKKAKKMKKSIKITSHRDMYFKLMRQEIYINKKMNPQYPIMAGGTYKDGHLQTIIMVWSLPFESNNLYEKNIFGVLCKLIEGTMDKAYEYMNNISESYSLTEGDIMSAKAFSKVLELYTYGANEHLVEFSLLKLKDHNYEEKQLHKLLKEMVRDTDYIGVNNKNDVFILLTNANIEEAKYVIDRLEKNQILVEIGGKYEN